MYIYIYIYISICIYIYIYIYIASCCTPTRGFAPIRCRAGLRLCPRASSKNR